MSEPKTPNLALNQIDRSSPATTYFDLDRYLDQNWSKVDDFAGEIKEQVDEVTSKADGLKERLDTEQRKSVTLKPGLQVIEAERASAFRLEGLKGRTLVNLLGRDGGFEGYNNWAIGALSASLDTTTYAEGSTSSLKITLASDNSNINRTITTVIGKKYVLIADVKNVSSEQAHVSINALVDGNNVASDSFGTSFARFTATAATHTIAVVGSGSPGQIFNVDNIRLYEVSADEYAALDSMTPTQVSAKYPYTEMITGVKNPYAIRYGQNLLPPFYEWMKTDHLSTVQEQYVLNGTLVSAGMATDSYAVCYINIIPNQDYTLTNPVDSTGFMRISTYNSSGTRIQGIFVKPGESRTIKMDATAVRMGVNVSGVTAYTDDFDPEKWTWEAGSSRTFKNPILNIGSTALPFVSCENAILSLQTELHADPDTGANPDMVFEREGQYFKLAKWNKLTLNGGQPWQMSNSFTGVKQIKLPPGNFAAGIIGSGIAVKYDGKIIPQGTTSLPDFNAVSVDGNIYLGVSNTDSGWGDSYTPTADEIKAYFMGWRMANNGDWGPYNGTGNKVWKNILRYLDLGGETVDVLPTANVPNWMPYQLLYQLATPTVEPITSEGQLTFFEGDNQVEVGTGIVLREGVKPARYGDWAVVNYTYDGNHALLQNKADVIKSVYKYSKKISGYLITRRPQVSYGNEYIGIPWTDFDSTDIYSVTYLMLAKYPAANFDGTYAENEKALLLDTVKTLQDNTTRISVLESKKAEKDSPAWITPTLLNGWVPYSTDGVYPAARFLKDSMGFVHFDGLIKDGVVSTSSPVFRLPTGFRPKMSITCVTVSYDGGSKEVPSRIRIHPSGDVFCVAGSNLYFSLVIPPFLGEQ